MQEPKGDLAPECRMNFPGVDDDEGAKERVDPEIDLRDVKIKRPRHDLPSHDGVDALLLDGGENSKNAPHCRGDEKPLDPGQERAQETARMPCWRGGKCGIRRHANVSLTRLRCFCGQQL